VYAIGQQRQNDDAIGLATSIGAEIPHYTKDLAIKNRPS
jgi:hypothetical protein